MVILLVLTGTLTTAILERIGSLTNNIAHNDCC
jgi:hypothetical protein